jgi:hypothetical protein
MAINLKKGESINLSKREPNLRKIRGFRLGQKSRQRC